MTGVIAVGADGLISLFFVRKSWQRKGIGKLLFQTVYNYGVQQLCVREIRVHATPEAVPAYERMGMHVDGPESLENGIPFVPMSVIASAGLVQPVRAKSRVPVIAAVVAAGLLVALILIGGVFLIRNIYQGIQERVQDSRSGSSRKRGRKISSTSQGMAATAGTAAMAGTGETRTPRSAAWMESLPMWRKIFPMRSRKRATSLPIRRNSPP